MKALAWIDIPLLAIFITLAARHAQAANEFRSLRFLIGSAIAAVGLPLWVTARVQLGESFAVLPEARKLVTTGLYAKIRNPVYVFGGLTYVGILLAWNRWAPLVFLAGFFPFQLTRIKKEEAVLQEAFGEEYRQYKARTWF